MFHVTGTHAQLRFWTSCSGFAVCLDCVFAVNNETAAYRMFHLVVWITVYAIVVEDCLTTLQVATKVQFVRGSCPL